MAKEAFDYRQRPNGDIVVFYNGRMAKLLRDAEAAAFLKAIADGDAQSVMAETVGDDESRPGAGPSGSGKSLGGDGRAHAHGEFRRRSS
jgi:hypothetical protein